MYAICNRATAICTLSEEPLMVNKYMYIAIYRASVLGLSVTTCNLYFISIISEVEEILQDLKADIGKPLPEPFEDIPRPE